MIDAVLGSRLRTREVSSTWTSYFARTPTGLLIDQRTPSGNYNPLY
jgi:hypothetical protein